MIKGFIRKFARRLVGNGRLSYAIFDDRTQIYKGISYRQYLEEALIASRPGVFGKDLSNLELDIYKQWRKDGTRPDEYLLYDYDHKSLEERDMYMPQVPKDRILLSYYGSDVDNVIGLLKDKYAFYEALQPFFKRDAIRLVSGADQNKFLAYCSIHSEFICKLLKGNCGVGVQIIKLNEDNRTINQIFKDLIEKGEWIIEELIHQHEGLSVFNNSSVNTVRFPSFRHGEHVVPALPCLRLGRKGNIVDNAGQGGVFVSVDVNTGRIITEAFDELGHHYQQHPDSGVVFKGYQIPQWGELINLVKETHKALPSEQTYVAFDFALSDKGWVVVEGNWGDWILQQTSLKRGLKKEFLELLHG